jgi:hypothetical protein
MSRIQQNPLDWRRTPSCQRRRPRAMKQRFPKPLEGWRSFVGEVGVVVLGVLIALAAGESLKRVEQRQLTREALVNIRAEVAEALGSMAARMASQPCVDRRIDEIAAALSAADLGETTRPFSWVGRPPFLLMSDARWDTASKSGATFLLNPDEQAQFSFIYSGISDFVGHARQEQAAWAQLRSLTEMRHLEAPQRAFLTQALQTARLASFRMNLLYIQRTEAAKKLGIMPKPDPLPVSPSICIDRDTPREMAKVRFGTQFTEPD